MTKNILKLISKGINLRNYSDPNLLEWAKKENNNSLITLLTQFLSPSNSVEAEPQSPIELDVIKKELMVKIALRESQERTYTRRTLRRLIIGATAAAGVASILVITIPKIFKAEDELSHNISVMYNNQSAIILSDGTRVILRPGSNLSYCEFDNKNKREVKLIGEAFFDVTKDDKKEFIVVAGSSTIKVLGTKFNVKANEYDNFVETTLLSGSVEFKYEDSAKDEHTVLMHPNEQLIFDKETKHYNLTENRKPLEYIINDEYKFDNVPLSKVFEVISDIYELEVIIDNKNIEDTRYTGVIRRSHSLENTMKILSEVASIKYYRESNSIIITHK